MSDTASGSAPRVLDPADRFEEIIFGLIMVLTFSCSLSVVEADRAEVRDMIVGALGCNLAWGIIDAAFYLVGVVVERGRSAKLLRDIRGAADSTAGRALVTEALPPLVAQNLMPQELERLRASIAGLPEPPRPVRLGRSDWLGALGVFLLVFVSTFPVVLPFFFIDDLRTALRLSNVIAIALIFGATWKLALHSGLRPLRTATAMVGIGVALVAIAIALGG
jgi:VIT1/CCC1 family predicted Fe2+/Mn2+ transporter